VRRVIGIGLAALAALCVVAATIATSKSEGDSKARLDIVYDDARGLVAGQVVQIAGARVGTIKEVEVTDDYKALVHTEVDSDFTPFRKDATCTIKPQGLIAENYIECDPGSPSAAELKGADGGVPTVPVKQTTQPVSLTDLFEVWNAPTADRARVLFSMLGMGVAARGQDFNDVLRRANPSLALARKTIGILERQRDELGQTVDATAEITAALAENPKRLAALVRHAGRVSTQTASQRGALGEGVRRLPALLAAATPALQRLDQVIDSGKPLVDQLGNAAPDINRVANDVPRLSKAAAPTLRKLGPVLRKGAVAARKSAPVTKVMAQYAKTSLPSARRAGSLFSTLEQRGFNSDLFGLFYNGALASARYDASGHILPAHVTLNSCGIYATTPDPHCGADGAAVTARNARSGKPAKVKAGTKTPAGLAPLSQQQPPAGLPGDAAPSPKPQAPSPKPGSGLLPESISGLLDYLLR
jgi:ABC-type transporter Mla subunit MlaD